MILAKPLGLTIGWKNGALVLTRAISPTRKSLKFMLSGLTFQKTSRHRKAALANHEMIHLSGDPF